MSMVIAFPVMRIKAYKKCRVFIQ